MRKIKKQNIFSYYWVQDALDTSLKEKADMKLKVRNENATK